MKNDSTRRPTSALRRHPTRAFGATSWVALVALGALLAPPPLAAAPPPLTVTNLGLHGEQFAITDDGAYVFFAVDEAYQGFADRNGDGDAFDVVLHVHDTAAGTTQNLGVATFHALRVDGHRVAFLVTEPGQAADLNGDGDALDGVPHVYDADAGVLTNVGVAADAVAPLLDGDWVLFEARESQQGNQDLNGDGDVDDPVLHVHDLATSTTTNLGLATRPAFGGPTLCLEGDRVTAIVGEWEQGATDLNGDGDILDGVAFSLNLAGKTAQNLGLAVPWNEPAPLFGDTIAVPVDEASQGGADLNGDGDSADRVLHLVRPTTPPIVNLGLAALTPVRVGSSLVFAVSEPSQGGLDFNGDGDGFDLVLFTYDLVDGQLHDLALASAAVLVDATRIAFGVYEGQQGNLDLNGDSDAFDWVLHVHDVVTKQTLNLETEGIPVTFQRRRIGYLANEFRTGPSDLNGDGDVWISEQVPHVYELDTFSVRNLGAAAALDLGDDDRILVRVSEDLDGTTDHNGDGDAFDDVLSVYEESYGTTIDLGIDGADAQVADAWMVFTAAEAANGHVDRNGDGDTGDRVIHVAQLATGVCGSILPYGTGCSDSSLLPPGLVVRGCSRPGESLSVAVLRGPTQGKAFLTFGAQRGELSMGSGCLLLVAPPLPLFLGPLPLSAFGSIRVEATIPSWAPSGMVRMQALLVESASGTLSVTNATEFEIE